MTAPHPSRTMLRPPYRPTLEPAQRIMRTQLTLILILALPAVVFFGYHALALILAAVAAAILAEIVVNFTHPSQQPGTRTHSVMMALLLAFTLPAQARWHVAFIGAAAAVIIGKYFFGGLGHYIWHPALVGRLIVQIFFNAQLTTPSGPILARDHLLLGNLANAAPLQPWLRLDWFQAAAQNSADAFSLPLPLDALRRLADLQFVDQIPLAQYLTARLPSLQHLIIGAVPGGIGVTCTAAIVIIGLFLIYRGYLNWQLPAAFLSAAYLAAMFLPLVIDPADGPRRIVHLPVIAENLAVGLTYANYHLLTGPVLFAAFILPADSTCRPITARGQAIGAAAAGLLAMLLRLYTPIPIPTFTAILVMNAATTFLDRLTRPH